jgi:NTE family protein
MSTPTIGLALSGGGSRAIAFHLGCLRALHDRGILEKITVLSGVSGGSVIAALYAYHDEPFEAFEERVEAMLRKGMVWGIVRHTFLSMETPKIVLAITLAGPAALLGRVVQVVSLLLGLFGLPRQFMLKIVQTTLDLLPRFASRTTAFENHLAKSYFADTRMDAVARKNLAVVLNAAELRTETAFRFGSAESGCWRFGRLVDIPKVATAVAASAAFPAMLPTIDRRLEFTHKGKRATHRAIITDGGVYDNHGVSCMLPGRSSEFSTNALPIDFVIACDAGAGIPTGSRRPYFWPARMTATITTIHRRTQTMSQNLLHRMAANGEIQGFIMPYLGQNDSKLPYQPGDLVRREETFEYPTDFFPMSKKNIDKLAKRGEQLTSVLIDAYAPNL